METTDKESCNILVSVLRGHGVRRAVISPGSRNAPLVVAFARAEGIECLTVVDERSAAFIALGISSMTLEPVALVCTSGTALLNYAPAVAEAYYRGLPLIVLSADRPMEWIDQDDSQTLRQYEALANFVKRSYDIPSRCQDDTMRWYVNRMANDAMLNATTGRRSPVHINVQLDSPLNRMKSVDSSARERVISMVSPSEELPEKRMEELRTRISSASKVLVVAGFLPPNSSLDESLGILAREPNAAVMCESLSNLRSKELIPNIDSTLSVMTQEEILEMKPEIVITLGGAIVSRFIKRYLRENPPREHWHVGRTAATVDCFKALTLRVDIPPEGFFKSLVEPLIPGRSSDYSEKWNQIAFRAAKLHGRYVERAPWCDLKAFSMIMERVPASWNLQLSNGTPVRYFQLFDWRKFHRNDCNRGVSGIDGCTSTAVGASLMYQGVTLLISGDASAQYDIGALANSCITPRFKMIVICNGGCGIFRFISSTRQLPELERYFVAGGSLPLREIAQGFGFAFFEACDPEGLEKAFKGFVDETCRPALLAVRTSGQTSAEQLRGYFNEK